MTSPRTRIAVAGDDLRGLEGSIGQRAITFFEQHGIEVSTGHTKTVAEAVEAWLSGAAEGAAACSGHHHEEGHSHDHGACGRSS